MVAATVLTMSMTLPRKYKAKAIFERRTDLVMTQIMHRGAPESWPNPRKALVEEVAGQPAIDNLIDKLRVIGKSDRSLDRTSAQLDDLRVELSKKILLHHDIATNELDRVTVELVDESPALAQAAVNLLVQNYIDRTRISIDARLQQTAEFFESEVQHSRTQIEAIENEMLDFEIKHARLLPNEPNGIQAILTETQLQILDLHQQKEAASTRVQLLKRQIQDMPETQSEVTTTRNPELVRLDDKRSHLLAQIETRIGIDRMTPKHPELMTLRQQITAIEEQIRQTPPQIVTHERLIRNIQRDELGIELTQARTLLTTLENQQHALEGQIERLNTASADLFPVRSGYAKLKRTAEQAQRQLEFWESNLRRVQMALTAEAGKRGVRLDFIKPCGPLSKPISPNLLQILAAAAALGLSAGGICVYSVFRSNESFSQANDLAQATDLPLFGSVSEIISASKRHRRTVRRLVFDPMNMAAMTAVLLALTGLLYLNLEKPQLYDQVRRQPGKFMLGLLDSRQGESNTTQGTTDVP